MAQVDSWDTCDQLCGSLFDEVPFAREKALAWADRDDTFVKRAGFVKKAVNWALRQIGKRNWNLHAVAVATAQRLRESGSKAARWVASDALRELTSDAVHARLGL